MPGANSSGLEENPDGMRFGRSRDKSFVENAEERVSEKFKNNDWKDNIRRNVSYKWKVPSHRNKFGDKAEEATMKFLGRKKFCKLLGEPIYLISGREYCYLKSENEQNSSGWKIGESDIVLITRKLGIINIEVKDRTIKTKTFQNMSAGFQRQSTKNLDSIKETVLRLANNIPQERLENTAITPNQIKDSLQLSKVPGLIALPKTKRSSIDFSGMEDQIASNIFFQEDFQSDDAFMIAFEDKVSRERTTNPLTWSKTVQDFIIAGLFSMTYTSAVFPFKGIGETSRALYNLTNEQAKVLTNQEIARRWITGPAGTGKTWLLIASTIKTYDAFMERKRGKGRIMVLTFNVAVKNFIKDTIDKLIEHSKIPTLSTANRSNSDKPKCEIKVYTIDGLKEHMKKEMIGKAKSCVKLSKGLKEQEWDDTMGRIVDEDNFDEVFSAYQKFVTDVTFLENFGFDSIFVDEAQDILQSNNGWISKIWRRKAKTPKYSKLWIFGDKSQNLYGFRDHETNEESLLDLQDDDFTQKLTHQLRSTNDIFERYHKARYEDQDDDTIEGNSATETDESESDDEDISDIHCNKCEMKPSGILGGKVEEMNCNRDSITTKLTAKIVSLVKDEKVLIEDIALLCVHYQDVEFLKTSTLKSLLAARNTGLGTGNGNIVICNAEDFATKCSKIRNKIQRKRKNEGNVVQKKFLMIDTVRRFKGLDAEVVILLNVNGYMDNPDLLHVGISRTVSKLIIFHLCDEMQTEIEN